MDLKVYRLSNNGESTIGALLINGKFECYTLEDEKRTVKVWGETRIPEGRYKVSLRTEGNHHVRYSEKFPGIHKGMLHVLDVPNFQYILIHIGNQDDDTAGCLLVGNKPNNNQLGKGWVGQSTDAYVQMYPKVAEAVVAGEEVTIEYIDLEVA